MTTARQQLAAMVRKVVLDTMDWHLTTQPPPEGTVSIVTDGRRNSSAVFKDGEWRRSSGKALPFVPVQWLGPKR